MAFTMEERVSSVEKATIKEEETHVVYYLTMMTEAFTTRKSDRLEFSSGTYLTLF